MIQKKRPFVKRKGPEKTKNFFGKNLKKLLTKCDPSRIINNVADGMLLCELYGLVVQLVRTLACHARGRGFEPHPGRHMLLWLSR